MHHKEQALSCISHRSQPIQLLRLDDVEVTVGLKKSTIYNLIKAGSFPAPIRIGKRTSRWNSAEVASWVKEQISQGATV